MCTLRLCWVGCVHNCMRTLLLARRAAILAQARGVRVPRRGIRFLLAPCAVMAFSRLAGRVRPSAKLAYVGRALNPSTWPWPLISSAPGRLGQPLAGNFGNCLSDVAAESMSSGWLALCHSGGKDIPILMRWGGAAALDRPSQSSLGSWSCKDV